MGLRKSKWPVFNQFCLHCIFCLTTTQMWKSFIVHTSCWSLKLCWFVYTFCHHFVKFICDVITPKPIPCLGLVQALILTVYGICCCSQDWVSVNTSEASGHVWAWYKMQHGHWLDQPTLDECWDIFYKHINVIASCRKDCIASANHTALITV